VIVDTFPPFTNGGPIEAAQRHQAA